MELPFSALTQSGAGRDGNCSSAMALNRQTVGSRRGWNASFVEGMQADGRFFYLEMPVRQQQTKWSQRVEPEKERGYNFKAARFTACQ